MPALSFSPECVADAKAKGLYLVRLAINGRHARRASMECTCQVGPKTAERVKRLFSELADVKKRMK